MDFLVGALVSMTMALTACSLDRAVEEGLTYKFHAAWSSVLQLLCVFFKACGRQAHPVMKKVSFGAAGPGKEVVLLDCGLLTGLCIISVLYSPSPRTVCPGRSLGQCGRNKKRGRPSPLYLLTSPG